MNDLPTLREIDRESLDGEISYEEASCVLKEMKNMKSPGTDGFSADFFKFFLEQDWSFSSQNFEYELQKRYSVSNPETGNYYFYI